MSALTRLMNRFSLPVTLALWLVSLPTAQAHADSTLITAALHAPAIGTSGGSIVYWGPIISQSSIDMGGSSNLNYPQKFAGTYFTGNGGPAGARSYCTSPGGPTSGPGIPIFPSATPVYEWFCNYSVPPAPTVNFADYRTLAQQQGNACNGGPCYNSQGSPNFSGINDPVCTVNGHPKVWFFEGNPKFSGTTYFCGVMVVGGSVNFSGSGAGIVTATPPATAWEQYQVKTPAGMPNGGDTLTPDEYPGDAGLHFVKPYNIAAGGGGFGGDNITFNGYIFASTGYSATGNTIVLGAVQFGQGAASTSGGGTIFFQPTTIFTEPPANTVNTPIITPPGGNFTAPVQVTITVTTSGAAIHYTLDGTTPNSSSPLYTGPFTLSTETTVKAIGTKAGMNNSGVATAFFTFNTGGPGSPAPILASLIPNTTMAGSPTFNMMVNGSNFIPGALVTWNGSPLVTTSINTTQLIANVPAVLVALPGTFLVQVKNPDNQTSGNLTFTVTAPGSGNPAPILTSLIPNTTQAGSPSFTLTANGSQFIAGAVVQWNGSPLNTTFISATQLTAAVPASLVSSVGTASVRVHNPDNQNSNSLDFNVTAGGTTDPAPTLNGLTPNTTSAGSPTFTIVANGSQFLSGAAITWNGSVLTTTFISSTQLSATVPASLVTTAGTASVRVRNPDTQNSNSVPFVITSGSSSGPAPVLSSLTPNTTAAGSPTFTLRANGTDFVSGAMVLWNGTPLSTLFVSSTRLDATVGSSLVASAGTANVSVRNPDNQTSGTRPFTITAPPTGGSLPLHHIQVVPSSATLGVGAQLNFMAEGYNVNNVLIPGVLFDWAITGPNTISPASSSAMTQVTAGSTPGVYTLTASSNAIQGQAIVAVQGGGVSGGMWLVDPATATPNPVLGTQTHLHVLADSTHPGPISYVWDFSGLAATILTPNAHDSDVTFTQPGTYTFNVTMTDSAGLQLFASVTVTVQRTVTRVVVTPATAVVTVGQPFPFTAQALDQWNQPMPSPFDWDASAGNINGAGSFIANSPMQNITVNAKTPNGVTGTARLSVTGLAAGSMDLGAAKAYPVPYKGNSGVPGITFTGLTADTRIRIYSSDGRLVQTLLSSGANILWDVRNQDSESLASGVYFYTIDNSAGQTKEGKLVIIK